MQSKTLPLHSPPGKPYFGDNKLKRPIDAHCVMDKIFVSDASKISVFNRDDLTFNTSFDMGDKIGKFNGITSYKDKLFVADSSNNSICVFNASDYSFVTSFNGSSVADGILKGPKYLCVSEVDQLLYVTDYNCIVAFNLTNYSYIKRFGSYLVDPQGICLSTDGLSLYVTERTNNQVVKVDIASSDKNIKPVGSKYVIKGQLNNPFGICLSADGEYLLVAEWGNHRISVFNQSDLSFVKHIGSQGSQANQLIGPHGLYCDVNGTIFVVDTGNHRITIFYDYTKYFGSEELVSPEDVHYVNNKIFVSDASTNSISVFNRNNLSFIKSFGRKGNDNDEFDLPWGIASYKDRVNEHVYVADCNNHRICVFNQSDYSFVVSFDGADEYGAGEAEGYIKQPRGILKRPRHLCISKMEMRLYVTDDDGIIAFNINDRSLHKRFKCVTGGLRGICLSKPTINGSSLYVADYNNNKVIEVDVINDKIINVIYDKIVNADGSEVIRLFNPEGVCLSANGQFLLVSEWGKGRISVFKTLDRTFVKHIGSEGSQVNQLNLPYGLYCDVNGTIFVADFGNERITNLDLGEDLNSIKPSSSPPSRSFFSQPQPPPIVEYVPKKPDVPFLVNEHLVHPVIVHCVMNKMFVTNTSDKIFVFNRDDFEFITSFKIENKENKILPYAGDIASYKDKLYVVDYNLHRICVFKMSDYSFVTSFNGAGEDEDEDEISILEYPQYLCISEAENRLYVTDKIGIVAFDLTNHSYIKRLGSKQYLDNPTGICLSKDGKSLYVAEHDIGRVSEVVIKSEKILRQSVEHQLIGPGGVCLSADGEYLLVSEFGNHRISVFKPSFEFVKYIGSFGDKEKQLNHPVGLYCDVNGTIFVGDPGNNRITIFNDELIPPPPKSSYFGSLISSSPQKLTEEKNKQPKPTNELPSSDKEFSLREYTMTPPSDVLLSMYPPKIKSPSSKIQEETIPLPTPKWMSAVDTGTGKIYYWDIKNPKKRSWIKPKGVLITPHASTSPLTSPSTSHSTSPSTSPSTSQLTPITEETKNLNLNNNKMDIYKISTSPPTPKRKHDDLSKYPKFHEYLTENITQDEKNKLFEESQLKVNKLNDEIDYLLKKHSVEKHKLLHEIISFDINNLIKREKEAQDEYKNATGTSKTEIDVRNGNKQRIDEEYKNHPMQSTIKSNDDQEEESGESFVNNIVFTPYGFEIIIDFTKFNLM